MHYMVSVHMSKGTVCVTYDSFLATHNIMRSATDWSMNWE